jgi:hypothetical protein
MAAGAPPKPTEGAHETDTVRELMRTGVAEYKKGNLQAARDAFLQAWAIKPHYAIAASLAEVEMALGQYRSTVEHLEYYLSNLPPELADKRGAAETQLAEARKHLTVLRVTVDSPDATVYVDGVAVEPGRDLLVEPGPHVLVAERGAVRTKPREVVFVAGQTLDQHLETKAQEPAPSAPVPAPSVASRTAADAGTTTHRPTTILIVGGALTVVAAGIGAGYSFDSASAQSEANLLAEDISRSSPSNLVTQNAQCAPPNGPPPPACARLHDELEHSRQSHDIALASFITAGVLAAGTLATYFLWPVEKLGSDKIGWHFAPWVGKSAAGSSFSVDF